MTPNRKPAKSTPSPTTLRERVLRNCLSEVRTKRNSMVQQYRAQSEESKNEIMKSFVSKVYRATKRDESQDSSFHTDKMEEDQDDGYLQSFEHQELLRQIADAVAFELENQQYQLEEEEFPDITDLEDYSRAELYNPDENTIICPLCRNGTMFISEEAGTASCCCGALISLFVDQSSSRSNSKQNSAQNSQETYGDEQYDVTYNKENSILLAAELKRRLGNVYDRHKAVCQEYQLQNSPSGFNMCNNYTSPTVLAGYELEFQIFGGHLCAYCAECSFYEQIT